MKIDRRRDNREMMTLFLVYSRAHVADLPHRSNCVSTQPLALQVADEVPFVWWNREEWDAHASARAVPQDRTRRVGGRRSRSSAQTELQECIQRRAKDSIDESWRIC